MAAQHGGFSLSPHCNALAVVVVVVVVAVVAGVVVVVVVAVILAVVAVVAVDGFWTALALAIAAL